MAFNDPTTNYNWNLPTEGGDSGVWDTLLNEIFGNPTTGIDAVVKAVSDVADAALPKAGGTMTGRLRAKNVENTRVNSGNISGSVAFDMNDGNFFHAVVTGNVTSIAFNNLTAGWAVFWVIELTNGGAFTVTWPASVKWPGGSAPTLQSSGVDVLVFYSRDGGTTVRGALAMGNSS